MLLFTLALRNLSRRRSRTLLTILGVGIAIAFTVAILSISEGLMVSFQNSLAKQGADIVVVPKEAEAYPYPDVAAFAGTFSEKLIAEIEKLDNVRAAYPTLTAVPLTGFQEKPGAIPIIYGVTPEYFSDVTPYLVVKEGRLLEAGDARALVAGSGIAQVMGLAVGDEFPIREQPFRVVGILETTGGLDDGMLFTPLRTLQEVYDREGQLTYVPVKVKDLSRPKRRPGC
jgi:putative ABC transport system permease protein